MWRVTFLTFLLSIAAGCFQFSSNNLEEEKDPNFLEGKKRVSSLDYDGAIEYFEKALQANPRSAAAHFELGVLHEQKGADFGAALYHFQKHLQLRPASPMAEVVKQHLTACKLELAKTVSFAVVNREVQRDLARLNQTNDLLKQRLEATVAELNRRPQYVTNYITNTMIRTQYLAQAAAPANDPGVRETPRAPERENTRETPQPRRTPPNHPAAQAESSQGQAPNRPANRNAGGSRAGNRPLPNLGQAPAAARPTGSRSSGEVTFSYTAKRGETLAFISRKFGISAQKISAANPGLTSSGVKEGRVIAIPANR